MKPIPISIFLLVLAAFSCNGRLTDEQKRKIREEREESQIKKISEAAITEAAFAYGRTIAAIIEKRDIQLANTLFIDSLQKAFDVEIVAMQTNDSTLRVVEKKIIEAYVSSGNGIAASDNIQKMGKDSILYTKPLFQNNTDGSITFTRALGLRMAKRQIIRSIK